MLGLSKLAKEEALPVARPGGLWQSQPLPEEGQDGMANHLLSTPNHPLQLCEVFSCCNGEPDGDGGGQKGLDDGRVEPGHHGLQKSEFPHLPEEVQSLLSFPQMFSSQDRITPRNRHDSTGVIWVSPSMMGGARAASSLKSIRFR